MDGGFELMMTGRDGNLFLLESDPAVRILDMAETHGHPAPPYIKRKDTDGIRRYQTYCERRRSSRSADGRSSYGRTLMKQLKRKALPGAK